MTVRGHECDHECYPKLSHGGKRDVKKVKGGIQINAETPTAKPPSTGQIAAKMNSDEKTKADKEPADAPNTADEAKPDKENPADATKHAEETKSSE